MLLAIQANITQHRRHKTDGPTSISTAHRQARKPPAHCVHTSAVPRVRGSCVGGGAARAWALRGAHSVDAHSAHTARRHAHNLTRARPTMAVRPHAPGHVMPHVTAQQVRKGRHCCCRHAPHRQLPLESYACALRRVTGPRTQPAPTAACRHRCSHKHKARSQHTRNIALIREAPQRASGMRASQRARTAASAASARAHAPGPRREPAAACVHGRAACRARVQQGWCTQNSPRSRPCPLPSLRVPAAHAAACTRMHRKAWLQAQAAAVPQQPSTHQWGGPQAQSAVPPHGRRGHASQADGTVRAAGQPPSVCRYCHVRRRPHNRCGRQANSPKLPGARPPMKEGASSKMRDRPVCKHHPRAAAGRQVRATKACTTTTI